MFRMLAVLGLFSVCCFSFSSAFAQATKLAADTSQIDVLIPEGSWSVPKELTFRARVTAITPNEKVDINWRHNGEGLGGEVFSRRSRQAA